MEKEFNLSEKVFVWQKPLSDTITTKDVKEFIKRLKKMLKGDQHYDWTIKDIDKLAGDKLI